MSNKFTTKQLTALELKEGNLIKFTLYVNRHEAFYFAYKQGRNIFVVDTYMGRHIYVDLESKLYYPSHDHDRNNDPF
jgi:hypothetical protein